MNFEMNDYKKMIRILVYPNITHNSRGQDIEADSFVQVIKKQILLLNETTYHNTNIYVH